MATKGIFQKTGDFLGVSKFGQGVATASRVLTGQVGQDIQNQEQNTEQVSKILYAAKQEQDPIKRTKLLNIAKDLGQIGTEMSASNIDPGLNLSKKEILGSAANVVLNTATPGAFKGTKSAIIGKNALLGSAFGTATGLEKNRSMKGVVGSTVGGALTGAALGTLSVGAKAIKDFTTTATPKWLMDKAIKPTLDESRKALKFGQESLGEELLREGVKGSPEKLLKIAEKGLNTSEDALQKVLQDKSLSGVVIRKDQITPYLSDFIQQKAGTPGLQGDVQRIKNVMDSLPEQMTLLEANQMKRRIYNELRDVSYKLDAKLSTKGKSLKMIASGLKKEIEKGAGPIGGREIEKLNQKLGLYGRLENRIVDQMARSMRNNSFGLTDAILTAGGLATMSPVGILGALSAAGVKHAGGSTMVRTNIAQGLRKASSVGTGKVAKTLKEVGRRTVLNLP